MQEDTDINERHLARFAALQLDPDRPLIICDADGVLVEFARPLERFLHSRDLLLDFRSFALGGNIRRRACGTPLAPREIAPLIVEFLEAEIDRPDLLEGVGQAIEALRRRAGIVVLTNVPHHLRERREAAFIRLGLDLPVFSNQGGKGPFVGLISARHRGPVLFIDDLPTQHSSVAEFAPDVYRIHLVAEPKLAPLVGAADHSHHRSDRWPDCVVHIATHLEQNGFPAK